MAKLVKTSDLAPHPELGGEAFLPRLTDDEFEGLVASIAESGIMQPIVVAWPERVILDGHHRWRAAQKLGLEEVPVMTEEFLDGASRVRLGLQLNLDRRQVSLAHKRHLVEHLLKEDAHQSDRAIAVASGMSHPTVASIRSKLEEAGELERVTTRTGRNGRKQRVGLTNRRPKRRKLSWDRLEAYLAESVVTPPTIDPKELREAVHDAVRAGRDTGWSVTARRVADFLRVALTELEVAQAAELVDSSPQRAVET